MPLLISSTNTSCGKTLITSALLASSNKISALKPIETGCSLTPKGELLPEDASRLLCFSTNRSLNQICFYRFASPVAPAVAAEMENKSINWEELVEKCKAQTREIQNLIIEGAGGLMVPITWEKNFLDLANELDAGCLLVVGSRLGAINETALSLEALKTHNIKILGLVVNDLYPESDSLHGPAIKTNPRAVAKLADKYSSNILLKVPFIENFKYETAVPLIVNNHQRDLEGIITKLYTE